MKQVVRIIFTDIWENFSLWKYQQVACEFLIWRNYVNRLLDYISNSEKKSSLGIRYVWNTAVGYDIFLTFKDKKRCYK